MNESVIVLGAGGHAKVVLDALKLQSAHVLGVTDVEPGRVGQKILGIPVIGGDDAILKYCSSNIKLVNGIGSIHVAPHRSSIFDRFKNYGYSFAKVFHPSAIVGSETVVSEGVQVMAGCVIQACTRIGKNTLINTCASVDHDCDIGEHVHIAPGVTLSGGVVVGDYVHIGTGATIVQGVRIGRGALVAAGAVVICDVPEGAKVMGIPAREIVK
ncbi:MAG: acetyltransferase [Bdellovibrio sp.]